MTVIRLTGLRVASQYGNFYESPASDLEFGTIDADKTICVKLEHTGKLDDRQYAFLQSAILYTTVTGERRVRVHNLALRVVSLAGNVFQYADMDGAVSYIVREGVEPILLLLRALAAERYPTCSDVQIAFYSDSSDSRIADGTMRADFVRLSEVLCCRCRPYSSALASIPLLAVSDRAF